MNPALGRRGSSHASSTFLLNILIRVDSVLVDSVRSGQLSQVDNKLVNFLFSGQRLLNHRDFFRKTDQIIRLEVARRVGRAGGVGVDP